MTLATLLDALDEACRSREDVAAVLARMAAATLRIASQDGTALLDADEAAAVLKVSPSTIRKLARTGALGGIRNGGIIRFRRADLDDWITRNQRKPYDVSSISAYVPRRRRAP